MSIVHEAAAAVATVAPTPVVSPSPSPSVTPLAQAATHAATQVQSFDFLAFLTAWMSSISQADIIAAAGIAAVGIQGLINKSPWLKSELAWLQDVKRFLVAVAIPFGGSLLTDFATGHNTHQLALPVFLVGQFVFYTWKALKGMVLANNAKKAAAAAIAETTTPVDNTAAEGQG